MQTKRSSFKEACLNTLVGFIITLAFSPLIYALCGIKTSPSQLGLATFYFTIISVARSYVIRRWFNNLKPRAKKAHPKGEQKPVVKDQYTSSCTLHSYVKISGGSVCQFCGDVEGDL